MPKWQRWLSIIAGIVIAGVGLIRLIGVFTGSNDLPGCDSQRAKDTLSTVFKEKNFSPTSYGEIKTISSTKDLVECEATLPGDPKGTMDVTYKFVRNGSDQRVEYSIAIKPPQ